MCLVRPLLTKYHPVQGPADSDARDAVRDCSGGAELRGPRRESRCRKEPLFWFKAITSLIPDGAKIEIPVHRIGTDFEAELAIVIGRRVRGMYRRTLAGQDIFIGYTSSQDISDRTIQNSESQWARAKSFDTFTPLGPYVETKIDPHDLTIQLFQNGQLQPEFQHQPAHFP